MKIRITVVTCALSLTLPLAAQQPCQAGDESTPIVDIRFEAPYRQIEPSMGDEWAPTWGRSDVLYTGNDDGDSFGGVPKNAIAFGKMEGNDPYSLKGTTINGMQEYRESPPPGPKGAQWRTVDSYKIGNVLYRFAVCGVEPDGSPYSCLMSSTDGGKAWSKSATGSGGEPLFRGTRFSAPSFISYDKSYEGVIDDKAAHDVFAASFAGVVDGMDSYIVGRVPKDKLAAGNVSDWSFAQTDWSWKPDAETARADFNWTHLGPDGANWKTMNTYSVDGVLYMFVTRCFYPSGSSDPKRRHIFQHSSIIKSTDNGLTWTRSAENNFNNPMFPGKRFGTAYFVWYGKDGAASSHNADKYVYAVSNNGHFENGDNYALGRVLRSKLDNLSAADWSFYTKGDGMQDSSWTSELDEAQPILTNPDKASMTGMTYIESLRRYVLVSWHYNQANFEAGIKAKDLSTVLEFFEAPKPWGPWTKVRSFETGKLGWYAPIIGQRFQTAANSNTTTAFLYATGFYTKPEGGTDPALYKFNYMPITLSTKPLQHKDPAFVGGR